MAKNLDIKIRGIADNIVFSDTDIYAYYEVSTVGYDFMNLESKVGLLRGINQGFVNLASNRDSDLDGHLIVTNTPIDIDYWESQFMEITKGWDRKPGFNNYFNQQAEYLRSRKFMTRKIYLGISLGKRFGADIKGLGIAIEAGWDQTKQMLMDILKNIGANDYSISDKEIAKAKSMENDLFSILSNSAMQCTRPSTEEIALIVKRAFYPGMPTPFLDFVPDGRWGHGDIIRETASDITKNRRWTEITQPINGDLITGYRATLTFSRFPERMDVPVSMSTPWIYIMQSIGIPFDMYARFTIIPSRTMKKTFSRHKTDILDEGNNAGSAGADLPIDLQEDYQKAAELEAYANKSNEPFLKGVYRIVLTSLDTDSLKNMVDMVKTQYSNYGITLTWTSGDQQDLLLEFMPGDHIREKSFIQQSNIELLGASGFNIFNRIGDDSFRRES